MSVLPEGSWVLLLGWGSERTFGVGVGTGVGVMSVGRSAVMTGGETVGMVSAEAVEVALVGGSAFPVGWLVWVGVSVGVAVLLVGCGGSPAQASASKVAIAIRRMVMGLVMVLTLCIGGWMFGIAAWPRICPLAGNRLAIW